MTVLITGANGFIGSRVVRRALSEGMDVRVFVRRGADLGNLEGLRVEKARGDIRDRATLRRALKGCTAVIHTAALYALWARDEREFFDVNVLGTRNVLEEALARGVKRIVYTSTIGAVGTTEDGSPATENTVWNLGTSGDLYTLSKYVAETEALRLCLRGCPVVIVNPSAPVGEGDLKPTPTGQLIVSFLKGQAPGYIDSGINLVDVDDVARGHLLALTKGKVGERYILSGENLTIAQLFRTLGRISGRRASPLRLPLSVARIGGTLVEKTFPLVGKTPVITRAAIRLAAHKLFYDCTKARRELGYTVSPVETALEKAVGWFRARGYAP